jgi:hypothetical protein
MLADGIPHRLVRSFDHFEYINRVGNRSNIKYQGIVYVKSNQWTRTPIEFVSHHPGDECRVDHPSMIREFHIFDDDAHLGSRLDFIIYRDFEKFA